MPNEQLEAVVFWKAQALKAHAARSGGRSTPAPFPVRLWEEEFREPDAAYMKKEHLHRCGKMHWDGAVVSRSGRYCALLAGCDKK